MECKTVFFTITIVVLSLALIVFIVLYILELSKCNQTKSLLKTQSKTITSLNDRVTYLTEKNKSIKVTEKQIYTPQVQPGLTDQPKLFVFGVADNISIICQPNTVAEVKSLFTKVVDDVHHTDDAIIDLTKYIPAFHMLNHKQIISLSSKTVVDNLKITIPYALPTDEIVKTRILYGEYVCKPITF